MLESGQVYILLGTFAVIFILQRLSAFRQEELAIRCGSSFKQSSPLADWQGYVFIGIGPASGRYSTTAGSCLLSE